MSLDASSSAAVVKKLIIIKQSHYPLNGFPTTLEELHINYIQTRLLDQRILQLTSLVLLDVSHNHIESLPTEINNLQYLRELNLSNNKFGKSSSKQWAWLGGNFCKTLISLDMSDNNLRFLPNEVIKLHSLISLHLDNNKIITLPPGIGCLRQLRFFTASNNLIFVLPGCSINWQLQTLDLSKNRFVSNLLGNLTAIFPIRLPVRTLKEYSARRILHLQLQYTSDKIPQTMINYLDSTKYCVCGQACFSTYFRQPHMLELFWVAQTCCVFTNDACVPIDCYFCTLKCFDLARSNRALLPILS